MSTQGDFKVHHSDVHPQATDANKGFIEMDFRFLVRDENAGSKQVCMWRTLLPPGAAHERHSHPNAEEIIYIVRGRAAAGAGDTEYELTEGCARYVPAGVAHWVRNPSDRETIEILGVYGGAASLEEAGHEFVGPITAAHRQVQ
jgi:quercetin dioxygenase-like cupin family protein